MDGQSEAPRIALSVIEAAKSVGLSRAFLYTEMSAGRLRAIKAGKRRLIRTTDLERWLARLQPAV